MKKKLLVLLTKYPTLGKVKTRLAAAVGDAEAVKVHDQLVKHCLSQVQSPDWDLQVCYRGADQAGMQAWLGDCWFEPQGPGDLGARISQCFDQGFSAHYDKICVIGSDIPGIQSQILTQFFQALEVSDLSIGPTSDGGYYGVALKRNVPWLFKDMPWSTETIFDATLDKAQQQNLSVYVGDLLHDVDDIRDWEKFAPLLSPQ